MEGEKRSSLYTGVGMLVSTQQNVCICYIHVYHDEALLQKRRRGVYHAYTPSREYIAESAYVHAIARRRANESAINLE